VKVYYPITVKLLSAIHINGGTDANGNRVTVRSDGQAYIPATLLKGMIRENFTKIWSTLYSDTDSKCTGSDSADAPCSCITCQMFGKAGFQRSRVYIDNCISNQELNYQLRSNVSIDRYTKKSLDTALVFTEVVDRFAKGNDKTEDTVFNGGIAVYYPTDLTVSQQCKIEAVLVESIKGINYIGLGKSRGLGFVEATIEVPKGEFSCERS
jgi:CRISPR/Cas system CSM-associated protein Csm3 (group 7 of RAMP superfamily)